MPPLRTLRIATRASLLARTQTGWIAERLRAAHPTLTVDLVEVTSAGDRDTTTPITALPQVGAFTKSLQDALADDRADVAVHSLKDLPTVEPDGLTIAAIPEREDPHDALVSASGAGLGTLAEGAIVGTGSPRRAQQLLERRPGVTVRDIRGNVDTRLAKVAGGDYDATILAVAGLRRIGRESEITEVLDFLPAPGQGALGVECRVDDERTRSLLDVLIDPVTTASVTAERSWLHATGAGCRTSAAAHATIDGDGSLTLRWFLDGRRGGAEGPAIRAADLGARAAEDVPS